MPSYYSMAITNNGTQFIYDGFDSVEQALDQFEVWENVYNYRILEAWIDVYESGKKIKRLSVAHKWVIESEDA